MLTACSVRAVTFTPGDEAVPDGGVTDGAEVDAEQPSPGPAMATITVSREGDATGTVAAQGLPISCGGDCTATVVVGTTVTLVATPDTGGVFGGWSGAGCAGGEATCTMTVTTDVAIIARFDVAMFAVDLELIGGGAGVVMSNAGLVCPGLCNGTFAYNTAIELTAAPAAGSTFTGWAGPCSGTGTCAFTVTAATSVTAGFALNNELIVTRTGNGGGSVSSSPAGIVCGSDCTQRFAPGTTVTLTATADADSVFEGWSGRCTGSGTCQLTMNQAVMATAKFVLRQHVLHVGRVGGGSGTVSSSPGGISCGTDCDEAYDAHTVVTLTASPAASSTFVGWSHPSCPGTGTCTLTMDAATSVTATFALQQFVLTVVREGSGTGAVQSDPVGISCGTDCSEAFDVGTTVTLTATPAAGSAFGGWAGACSGTGTCQLQITSASTVTAKFFAPGGLYMINQNTDRLERMDSSTLVGTDIGPLGVAYNFGDCAWNPADARLYMVEGTGPGGLYRIDLATGAASLVGMHGVTNMLALAYHPPSNQLYGIATDGANNLYKIDAATGAATLVGPTGAQQVEGLVWDSKRNVMTALSAITNLFYAVNLDTGAATPLQPSTGISNLGMTYDPFLDRFWVADATPNILQFDPSNNFARTAVTTFSTAHTCIALVPNAAP